MVLLLPFPAFSITVVITHQSHTLHYKACGCCFSRIHCTAVPSSDIYEEPMWFYFNKLIVIEKQRCMYCSDWCQCNIITVKTFTAMWLQNKMLCFKCSDEQNIETFMHHIKHTYRMYVDCVHLLCNASKWMKRSRLKCKRVLKMYGTFSMVQVAYYSPDVKTNADMLTRKLHAYMPRNTLQMKLCQQSKYI